MKPNVLLISADDMNDWVGCLNRYPGVQTPAIDGLARRSVLFSNAHCPSPLCNPSRTAILTGTRPNVSGVYGNDHWWRPAMPDVVTLPEHFRNEGYRVAGAGKVFHHTAGFNPPDIWDEYLTQIFDDPWSRKDTLGAPDVPFPEWHPKNGMQPYVHELDWGVLDIPEESYGDAQAVDWAIRYLKRAAVAQAGVRTASPGGSTDRPGGQGTVHAGLEGEAAAPFFLAVGSFRPHLPNYAPQAYFDRYPIEQVKLPNVFDADMDVIPPIGRDLAARRRGDFDRIVDQQKWEEAVQAYLACISFADAQIGRLLAALTETGLDRNTVVVFYSDNGFHLGQKHHWYKCTLWEPGTHVPLVISVPEQVRRERGIRNGAPGQNRGFAFECTRAVNLIDIYPTIVELCGLRNPASRLDGVSLVPLIADRDAKWERLSVITFERGNHAVRSDSFRYIRYADGGEELYHCKEDPDETANLSNDAGYADVRTELSKWVPRRDAPAVPGRKAYDFDPVSYSWRRKP